MKKSGRYLLMTAFTLGTLALGTVSVATKTAAPVLAAGWSYPVAVVKGQAALLLNSDGGDLRQERSLPAKSAWRVFGQATYQGKIYYKVSNTGWILADSVTRSGSGNIPTVKPVANVNNATALLSGDPSGSLTNSGRTLAKGTRWQVLSARKDSNGTVWYNVGGWIKASDARLDGIVAVEGSTSKPAQPTDKTAIATMTVAAQPYGMTADKHTYQTGSTLGKGSRWKVLVVTKDPKGVQWYLIGNNVWINSNQASIVNADQAKQENYAWPIDPSTGGGSTGGTTNPGTGGGGTTNPGTGGGTTQPGQDPPVTQKVDPNKYSDAEYRRLVDRQIASLSLPATYSAFMGMVNGERTQKGLAPFVTDTRITQLAQKLAYMDAEGLPGATLSQVKQMARDLGFTNVRNVAWDIGGFSGQYTKYNWGDPNSVAQFMYWVTFDRWLTKPGSAFANYKYGAGAISWNEAGGALRKNDQASVRIVSVDAD
jgi:hypothetical protein